VVGCPRWNRDKSIHVNKVDVRSMGHDRSPDRFRLSTLMLPGIVMALALTFVAHNDDHDRSSPRPREKIGPMLGG
jgi:hypothetical protein